MAAAGITSGHVARETNARIREQCRRFSLGAEATVGFMCECGCLSRLETTVAAYDGREGPLLAPGHPHRPGPLARLLRRAA